MKSNMALADRVFRILFSVVVAILYFTGALTGTLGIILLIVGGILLATSFLNFCPIYASLGLNFSSKKNS